MPAAVYPRGIVPQSPRGSVLSTVHLPMDGPPYRLSGTVYGALLNHRTQLDALGDAVDAPPYKAPPRAPVLTVMPRHMLAADGSDIVVPAGFEAVEIGPALGIVIRRVACRVSVAEALSCVAGYVRLGEVNAPLASHYRPAVRLRCRDGYCPVGPAVSPAAELPDPDGRSARVWLDGELVHDSSTAGRVRGVARLVADVSAFMTLQPGDVLSLGRSFGAPLARPGQRVKLEITGLAALHHVLVAEGSAA